MPNVDMAMETGAADARLFRAVASTDKELPKQLKPSTVDINRPARSNTDITDRIEKVSERIAGELDKRLDEIHSDQFRYNIRKNMRLAIFEPTGDMYAKILNADTGELVKSIPPEALLRTWARMEAYVGGLVDMSA